MSTHLEQSPSSSGIVKRTPLFFDNQPLYSVTLLPTIKNLGLGILRHWTTVYSFPKTLAADLQYNPETRAYFYHNIRSPAKDDISEALNCGSHLYDGFVINMVTSEGPLNRGALSGINFDPRAYQRLNSASDRGYLGPDIAIKLKKTVTLADIASCIFVTMDSYNIDNTETLPGSFEDGVHALERQITLLMHFSERGWVDRGEVESIYARAKAFIQPVDATPQASQTQSCWYVSYS